MMKSEMASCPHCERKNKRSSPFCATCGFHFRKQPEKARYLFGLNLIILLTLVVYITARFVISKQTDSGKPIHVDIAHVDEAPDSAETQQLKAEAENGEPAALMALAEHLIQQSSKKHDYLHQAAQTLERLLETYPKHSYTLRLLGNIFYNLRLPEKSVFYYRLYLNLHPNDANVRTDLGTQLLSMGHIQDAIKEYQAAIDFFPDFYNAHFNLSIAFQKLGNLEESEAYRTKAAEIDRRHGKKPAMELQHPRLPENLIPATKNESDLEHPQTLYTSLEQFFQSHSIIGPKMERFQASPGKAILYVSDFPMNAMPPMAKKAFEQKIMSRLKMLSVPMMLEIRDSHTQALMASYNTP